MDYLDLKFQWYTKGIFTTKPSGYITLRQLIEAIINPKPKMIEVFKKIEEAGKRGDKKEKDKLKTENLFFTTPSAIFDPIRNYESITEFLPLGVFEYDDIEYGEELKKYIFEKRKDCIFAFNSPSKTGVKFIFLFGETPTSVEHYKELWFGIAHSLDKFKNLDLSNERCTQPLFNSYDSNALYRTDAEPILARGYKENSFKPKEVDVEVKGSYTEDEYERCMRVVKSIIDGIVDSGHNQVIVASTLGGGLSAYYGIPEIWDVLEERIIENEYLSKNTKGYLKTANEMYNKGFYAPIPLTDK